MTRFLLVRHGHVDRAGVVLHGSAPGVPLSALGERQVHLLSGLVRSSFHPDAVFCSPLERTRQTAEILSEPLGVPPQCRSALREMEFGGWTGKTIAELSGDPEFQRFNRYRSCASPPGGELAADAQGRIVREMDRLRRAYPEGTIVLVSHAELIRLAVAYYAGISLDLSLRIGIDLASLTGISVSAEWVEIPFVNRTGPTR